MKVKYKNKWFKVVDNGKGFFWVNENGSHFGGSVILAQRSSNKKIAFIQTYRNPLGRLVLELPRGFADHKETPIQCAAREFMEETGIIIDSKRFKLLGKVSPNSGLLSSEPFIFKVKILEKDFKILKDIDSLEVKKVIWLSKKEIISKIKNQEITDGFSISALWFLENIK